MILDLMMPKMDGFTLIEILIVIAILAILGGVVFVALDPLTRFQDARDASRLSDLGGIITAIKIDQVDNGGQYLASIASMTTLEVYMIVDGALVGVRFGLNRMRIKVRPFTLRFRDVGCERKRVPRG